MLAKKKTATSNLKKTEKRKIKKKTESLKNRLTIGQTIGLLILAIVIVSFISIFSFFIHGSNQNILGLWVGQFLSKSLLSFCGELPTIILLFLSAYVGICMVVEANFRSRIISLISFLVLYLDLCMLLNITNTVNDQNLHHLHLKGGSLGLFLNDYLLKSVFGQSPLGYYLVSLPVLFFSFIWGFRISFMQLLSWSIIGAGKIINPILGAFETVFYEWREKKVKRIQKRKQKKSNLSKTLDTAQKSNQTRKSKKTEQNLDEIRIEELAKNINWKDPLEVRRYRDKEAELRRVKELNEWEIEERQPTFAGTITKPSHSVVSKKIINLDSQEDPENLGIPQADLTNDETGIKYDVYKIVDLNQVLKDPPKQSIPYSESVLKEQAAILEEQLANFKVMGKVVEICTGPVIVRYEVALAPGVKVSQVAGLADDLALSLKAKRIRILAPIPGKSVVGIEVPSSNPQIVYIKDVLCSIDSNVQKDNLEVVLGKSMAGEPVVIDLVKSPHLLIAGQTGSGKSVCINALMVSILGSKTPDQVRMILIDPKVVELKPYDKIPHLLGPVINQAEAAVQALNWATYEMDRRYNILSKVGVRNISGFNEKFRVGLVEDKVEKSDFKLMPYIIIVIDELADLMMVAGKDVETSIARIAQKARAVGIHLIVATQRPSTNVITGTIKANLPTRIAFQVASYIDSRTIIDKSGAEKLLGRGDMLYRSIEAPDVERVHGAFVSDQEAEDIAKACSSQFVNYPQIETFDLSSTSVGSDNAKNDRPRDSKFRDAAELVCGLKQGSASLLQRRMSIGYARAGRLIDQLEEAGIVGPDRGTKPRFVLMDELEVQSFLSSGLND